MNHENGKWVMRWWWYWVPNSLNENLQCFFLHLKYWWKINIKLNPHNNKSAGQKRRILSRFYEISDAITIINTRVCGWMNPTSKAMHFFLLKSNNCFLVKSSLEISMMTALRTILKVNKIHDTVEIFNNG